MRALAMRKRKMTFAFDVLKLKLSHSCDDNERDIVLVREHDVTPEAQAQAYVEHLSMYFNKLDIHSIDVGVERHACEYVTCANCGYEGLIEGVCVGADLYDTPWDEKPEVRHFCSYMCVDSFTRENGDDFAYVMCNGCHREICQQNPSNGWHYQFRDDEESGEQICLKCYQTDIMNHGQPREKLEGSTVPGMFHDSCELREAGWIENGSYFIRGTYKDSDCQREALRLIDGGNKVIIDYESLGIGGGEGYVAVWYKSIESKVTAVKT